MEYRILPVQVQPHGLKERDASDVLNAPVGQELFRREGIKLISMGIYADEEEAKAVAAQHSGDEAPIFV
jgi:hypothetical protein